MFHPPLRDTANIVYLLMFFQSHFSLLWWYSNYFFSIPSSPTQSLVLITRHQLRCHKYAGAVYFFLYYAAGISQLHLMCIVGRADRGLRISESFPKSCRFCFLGIYFLSCKGWVLSWFNLTWEGHIRSFLAMSIWEGLNFSYF